MENAANKLITADEFFEMIPETNEAYELHNGEVIALASSNELHHDIATEAFFRIKDFIKKKGGSCKPFLAAMDVKLDDYNVVQPDIFVVCDPKKRDGKRINGAPDFIIEITSSNRYNDLVRKLGLYMRSGVREYWIIDPLNRKTLVYRFEETDLPSICGFDETIPVGIFGGELEINVSGLTEA